MTDTGTSYRVGPSPLPVRAEPDPTAPPVTELVPGEEVAVLEQRGAWADVLSLSGTRGWVDAGQLVQSQPPPALPPMPMPERPPDNGQRNAWIFIGVVAVVVLIAAVLIASSGDTTKNASSASSQSGPPPTASVGPETSLVHYQVPSGWFLSQDGLVIAEKHADLTAAKPSGARITAKVSPDNDDPATILQQQKSAGSSFDVIEPPIDTATVSGAKAVRATIRKGDQIVQFIAVHPPGHDSVLFTVECPADRFEQLQDAINSAPGLNL